MKTLFPLLMSLLLSAPSFAQSKYGTAAPEKTLSVQVERQSTGSGHVNFTSIGTAFRIGKSEIYAGAVLEDRSRSFKGLKMTYRFFPEAFGANISPYFQYDLVSRWNSRLTNELEKVVHGEAWDGKRHEKYRTVEHYMGFGMETPLPLDLYLDLGIGLGLYHSKISSSFDDRIEDPRRFRKGLDASLSLKVGLGYEF
jgi:hypothetical protein